MKLNFFNLEFQHRQLFLELVSTFSNVQSNCDHYKSNQLLLNKKKIARAPITISYHATGYFSLLHVFISLKDRLHIPLGFKNLNASTHFNANN